MCQRHTPSQSFSKVLKAQEDRDIVFSRRGSKEELGLGPICEVALGGKGRLWTGLKGPGSDPNPLSKEATTSLSLGPANAERLDLDPQGLQSPAAWVGIPPPLLGHLVTLSLLLLTLLGYFLLKRARAGPSAM